MRKNPMCESPELNYVNYCGYEYTVFLSDEIGSDEIGYYRYFVDVNDVNANEFFSDTYNSPQEADKAAREYIAYLIDRASGGDNYGSGF